MVRAHVFIIGNVQGVGFRYYAKQEAEALHLAGWVRNVKSAKLKVKNSKLQEFTGVEAIFEGEDQNVREMIAWCWDGSPTARVEDVEVAWEIFDSAQVYRGFEIRSTE